MIKCSLCNRDTDGFNGLVWYSGWTENNLCKSHYFKWCKSKERIYLENFYKKAKPATKQWHRKCVSLQVAFDKWLEKVKDEK